MKRLFYTTVLAILVAITLNPASIVADIAPTPPRDYTVKGDIAYYAKEFNVPEEHLLIVAKCESNFNTTVYGDHGAAYSVFQFHKPTFDTFAKKLGEDLNYYSSHDQVKLAAYMFSTGQQKHWTCSRLIKPN